MPKLAYTGKFICFDYRTCNACNVAKPLSVKNFEMRNRKSGRMSNKCKPCARVLVNKRHSAPEFKLKMREKAQQMKEWYTQYHKSAKAREKAKEYRASEHGKVLRRSLGAKRRAAQLNRTPKWADLKVIHEFYKNCPEGMQVDHIIPLQGKIVSGFHILENLQYLTISENCTKRNKF